MSAPKARHAHPIEELPPDDHPSTPSSADVRRFAFRISRLLGLTTGVGVMAWGAWSLAFTVVMAAWDDNGARLAAIEASNAFNQGVLQSAMLVALCAMILELRRIGNALDGGGRR